jgi:valyl-tRNA synthetase
VSDSIEGALELAKNKSENLELQISDLTQDTDVLDTWFSSWLWPISVFDGVRNPENEDIKYYYPTNDLVTGPDIIFFWVARMIVAGYEFKDQKPFTNVYFTGLVRDKQRRKMSKSLGNSPDALKLIDDFGADGVRVGLLLSSAAGNDLMFDEALCQQGKAFGNKIWNAFRLIKGWEVIEITQPDYAATAIDWYQAKFQKTLIEINDHFSKYRLSDALMMTYKLIWDDFCSWLLEMVKPAYQAPIDKKTYDSVVSILESNLKILHPFMPFLTEEIWQILEKRTPGQALIVASWPEIKPYDHSILESFEFTAEVVSGIRTVRKEKNIPFKNPIDLLVLNNESQVKDFDSLISKLGNITSLSYTTSPVDNALSFRVKSNEYFIPANDAIDIDAEILKIEHELKYTEGFLKSVQKKLSNKRFVLGAPEQVVSSEKKKEMDAVAKIETLKASLINLK